MLSIRQKCPLEAGLTTHQDQGLENNIELETLQQQFPFMNLTLFNFSNTTGVGISTLRDKLLSLCKEFGQMELANSWHHFANTIVEKRSECQLLSTSDLLNIGQQCGVPESHNVVLLLLYFTIGV